MDYRIEPLPSTCWRATTAARIDLRWIRHLGRRRVRCGRCAALVPRASGRARHLEEGGRCRACGCCPRAGRQPGRHPHLATAAPLRGIPPRDPAAPPRSTDPSFPSDHASAAFGIAVGVLLIHRRAGHLFLAAAFLIAVSRVATGMHYPTDVLAGALIGSTAGYIAARPAMRPLLEPLIRATSVVSDPVVWFVRQRQLTRRTLLRPGCVQACPRRGRRAAREIRCRTRRPPIRRTAPHRSPALGCRGDPRCCACRPPPRP